MAKDPYSAMIGAGVSGITGLAGLSAKNRAEKEASDLRKQLLQKLAQLNTPSIASQELQLEELASQGQLTPEMVQLAQQQDTGLNDITTNPQFQDAQMDVLSELEQLANNGFSVQDAAALNKVRNDVNAADRGRREAIAQRASASGRLNSGTELAMQLRNAQDAVTNESNAALDIAADGRNRAYDALIARGQLGSQMRDQEFGEKSSAAKAQDMINEFNTRNKQAVYSANTGARNDAQRFNLGEKQRIADTNVGTRNQQQQYNKGLLQSDFDNRMNKFGAESNEINGQAQAIQQSGRDTAAIWGGIGKGANQVIAGYSKRKDDDEDEE